MADLNSRLLRYDQEGFFEKRWRLMGGSPEYAYVERDAHSFYYAVSCSAKDITTGRDQSALLRVAPIDEESLRLPRSMPRELRARRLRSALARVKNEIDALHSLQSVTTIAAIREWTVVERRDAPLPSWDVLMLMERTLSLRTYRARNPHAPGSGAQLVMALRIWNDIISALCVCENIPLIHANIKPGSVRYQPEHDTFKLSNFGVSMPVVNFSAGIRVGTLEYMAPEMYDRRGGDRRADIYSLAVMIYELLNGERLPLQAGDGPSARAQAWGRRLREGAPIPPIEGMPTDVNQVLLKCLESAPDKRYDSCKKLKNVVLGLYVNYKKYADSEKPLSSDRKLKFPQPGAMLPRGADRPAGPRGDKTSIRIRLGIAGLTASAALLLALIICAVALPGSQPREESPAASPIPGPELKLEEAQLVAGTGDAAVRGRVSVSGEIEAEQLEVAINGARVDAQWEDGQDALYFVAPIDEATRGAGPLELSVGVAGEPSAAARAMLALPTPEPVETEMPAGCFAPIRIDSAVALGERSFGQDRLPRSISGRAQPGEEIKLTINGEEFARARADEDGRFELPLSCVEGINALRLSYVRPGAPEGTGLRFWQDTRSPVLSQLPRIDQYAAELEVRVEDQDRRCRVSLLLDGERVRTVSANDGAAKFTRLGELNLGAAGKIELEATDSAGNVGRISVEYEPQPTREPRYVFQSTPVEAAVCMVLGMERGEPRLSDLSRVEELRIEGAGSLDLTDLAHMTKLKRLHIRGAKLDDLSIISDLKGLEELELTDAGISDIAPLAGLTELVALDLRGNAIWDVRPLAGLSGLKELDLSDNRIVDAAPLEGLSALERLRLDGNPLGALSGTHIYNGYDAATDAGAHADSGAHAAVAGRGE